MQQPDDPFQDMNAAFSSLQKTLNDLQNIRLHLEDEGLLEDKPYVEDQQTIPSPWCPWCIKVWEFICRKLAA